MGNLLVRDIDDGVEAALRRRAAWRGVSMESEVRDILRDAAARSPEAPGLSLESPEAREARFQRILALGKPPLQPFDLKAFSDALSDGTE